MHEHDFVAIGDVVNDEFITLRKDEARVDEDPQTGRALLSMYFGDKLPYEQADIVNAVGNSSNAAVCAHRLGLKSAIVTNIGDDDEGKLVQDAYKKEGIETLFVRTHPGKHTNHHYVLRYGAERTILIKHEEFDYTLPENLGEPKWIYFSSVGENSLPYHHEIAAFIKSHPNVRLAFQPGSFQIKLGYEKIKDVYEVASLFFCNKEEAQKILHTDATDFPTLIHGIQNLGVRTPVITDGPKGAYAIDSDGTIWKMPMYPDPMPPIDRTGAGDSFSSTFTVAYGLLGKSIPEALSWGPINSMSVVQYIGAQKGLLTRAELEKFLAEAPKDYLPAKVG